MKLNFKLFTVTAFLGLFLLSCSSDDDNIDIDADSNPERFKNIEIGNKEFKVPQFNTDLHTQLDYVGKSKVKEMYFDITPVSVDEPKTGEVKWEVSKYLVPEKYYKGKLNPHIHHHIFFDPINENFPKVRPVKGTYNFKITVIEEDNSESVITKQFEIVKRFFDLEIGDDNKVVFGSDELHTEFTYEGTSTVSEIKYQLWFEEWRDDANVPAGDWDNTIVVLPANLYEGKKNPHIHYHLDWNPDFPVASYWLNIYVKESGEKEAVKLSIPVSVTN